MAGKTQAESLRTIVSVRKNCCIRSTSLEHGVGRRRAARAMYRLVLGANFTPDAGSVPAAAFRDIEIVADRKAASRSRSAKARTRARGSRSPRKPLRSNRSTGFPGQSPDCGTHAGRPDTEIIAGQKQRPGHQYDGNGRTCSAGAKNWVQHLIRAQRPSRINPQLPQLRPNRLRRQESVARGSSSTRPPAQRHWKRHHH